MTTENITQLTPQVGSADTTSLLYAVTGTSGNFSDTSLPLSVFVHSLGLTGVPTTPTPTTGTNTTQIASTAFVQAQLTSTLAAYAPLASPTFTGTPTAPTAANGTNTTQLATTAFVASTLASPPAIGNTAANTGAFTTLSSIGTFTPSTTAGIVGTTLADNANAGSVGELITATASGVSLTTNTPANITSVSLTAGDWDVQAVCFISPAGTTNITGVQAGVGTTSGSFTNNQYTSIYGLNNTGSGMSLVSPVVRINISTTTTCFALAQASFTVSTCIANAVIRARRVR